MAEDTNGEELRAPKPITAASVRDYWRTHNRLWANVDLRADPAGLANVCHAGAPYYVNRYAAKCQERVFDGMLARIPHSRPRPRALDVGCGAARWSRRLSSAGWSVVGIDLQPDLLDRNRREFPDIEFVYSPIQDYRAEPFDLVTSVTVIQHNPDAEQERIVRTLRQLLRTGGHALIMENIVDRLPNVFARDPEGWRALFERAGFRQITRQTYDYRLLQRTMRRRRAASGPRLAPAPQNGSRRPGRDTLKRIIVAADSALEPALVAAHAKGATHCAFLFVAE